MRQMCVNQLKPHVMNMESVLVPIALFASVFGVLYVYLTARHRQRMALIEKGATVADLREPYWSLKLGMLGIGVGIGLLLGYLLDTYVMVGAEDDPLPYFIMVTVCGGAALIGHYFIVRRKQQG